MGVVLHKKRKYLFFYKGDEVITDLWPFALNPADQHLIVGCLLKSEFTFKNACAAFTKPLEFS